RDGGRGRGCVETELPAGSGKIQPAALGRGTPGGTDAGGTEDILVAGMPDTDAVRLQLIEEELEADLGGLRLGGCNAQRQGGGEGGDGKAKCCRGDACEKTGLKHFHSHFPGPSTKGRIGAGTRD